MFVYLHRLILTTVMLKQACQIATRISMTSAASASEAGAGWAVIVSVADIGQRLRQWKEEGSLKSNLVSVPPLMQARSL